ncbi:hypothetical protein [Kordia sp.]|uniref:hypothetical protein n=1 Tax=Kordia sp. TaxID=1965332 RepID=UPI003B5ACF29
MQKPLTQKDKKKLRRQIIPVILVTLVAITIFILIFTFVIKDFTKNEGGFGYVPMIIFSVFGLFFAGIIGYITWTFIRDIKGGVKNCFDGIIEDKRLNIRQTTSHSSGAGARRTGRRKTSTKREYYITVAGTEHNIDFNMYNYVSVGDHIYFEIAPKSNTTLHYEILEEAISEHKQIENYTRATYPNSKIRKAPLTQRDKDLLKSFYSQKLRSRLIVIAFLAFPVVGLLLNGLGGLLVFLFPLPIILIYQLYKLIRFHLNYKKSVDKGRKKLITTQITDKLFTTISRNGAKSQKRAIKTTYKVISVSEDLYQKLNSGDEIIIHEALNLDHTIGISVDETYYPFS